MMFECRHLDRKPAKILDRRINLGQNLTCIILSSLIPLYKWPDTGITIEISYIWQVADCRSCATEPPHQGTPTTPSFTLLGIKARSLMC
jgi:hypothetical protein